MLMIKAQWLLHFFQGNHGEDSLKFVCWRNTMVHYWKGTMPHLERSFSVSVRTGFFISYSLKRASVIECLNQKFGLTILKRSFWREVSLHCWWKIILVQDKVLIWRNMPVLKRFLSGTGSLALRQHFQCWRMSYTICLALSSATLQD